MSYKDKLTIECALLMAVRRYWQWRSDAYWRNSIRELIMALRSIRAM